MRSSLTSPIPPKLRKEMDADPYYQRCAITGTKRSAYAKVEWHHAFKFAGKRVNEKWCIIPLLKRIHDKADTREVKDFVDFLILNRADDETLIRYSRGEDLLAKRARLNKRYADKKDHPLL